IFCLSSVNEAFPNVVVEAMAMGLPCVVTRAGDAADILGDDDFVVPVKDSQALCDALTRLRDLNPEARRALGERGAKRVRAEYEIKHIRQKYEDVYAETARRVTDAGVSNSDPQTVEGFGYEWTRFDQSGMSNEDTKRSFESYFSIFPWEALYKTAVGLALDCGSGRWAMMVATRVGTLHCID